MSKIVEWIMTHKWAITPQALLAIIDIAERVTINIDPKTFHGDLSTITPEFKDALGIKKEALVPTGGRVLQNNSNVHIFGKVGIIDIFGPLFPRSSSMLLSSPGVSITGLSRALDAALESNEINSIILNIDSPGGEITDIEDFGEKIFNAQAKKPILAFVTGMAASAGYWIASSTSEIIAAKTSEVGSIGVVAAIRDTSEKDEKAGIKNINIVSSVSPKKRPDFKTAEGQADIKAIVDELGFMFVEAVARNRGTDKNDVVANFGQGSMILSIKAKDIGMVDRIDSLENLIIELNKSQSTGGIVMTTLVKDATAVAIKSENPNVYKEILDSATGISVEAENKIKDDAFKSGADHENARIKEIESLVDNDNKEIIQENKFNMEMTKEDVALVIVDKQKKDAKEKADGIKKDAKDLADTGVKADLSDMDEDKEAAAQTMAGAMNDKRGIKDNK